MLYLALCIEAKNKLVPCDEKSGTQYRRLARHEFISNLPETCAVAKERNRRIEVMNQMIVLTE